MIQVIYGAKGSGKTKMMMDGANGSANLAKGLVVYLDKDSDKIHHLDQAVRLVDANYYGINNQEALLAFVKGMLATNFDIEKIYIDGIAKIAQAKIEDMQLTYDGLAEIAETYKVTFVISASCDKEALPPFVAKLI